MKSFDLNKTFCEVLSSLAIMSLSPPLLDLLGKKSLWDFWHFARSLEATQLAGILILAYMLGLIMDAIGIALGEWFLYRWLYNERATLKEWALYYKNLSSADVFGYGEDEWAYLTTYTNLLIIAVPAWLLWTIWTACKYGWLWALIPTAFFFCLGSVFVKSVRWFLELDAEITKAWLKKSD